MLNTADNEMLTKTGSGTPMGTLFRRFWFPALLSSEVPDQGGAPIKVKLLGEDLIAFRGDDGKVALMDARCPHRLANLFWGRNEGDGIRCVYHGWKFGFDGRCLDMPAEPADGTFKDRVTTTAYSTHEAGGLIWAYMGPEEVKPEFPKLEFTFLPDDRRKTSKRLQLCNWFQNVEGELDSAHVGFLHRDLVETEHSNLDTFKSLKAASDHPEYSIAEMPFGLLAIAERKLGEGQGSYWRIARHFPNLRPLRA